MKRTIEIEAHKDITNPTIEYGNERPGFSVKEIRHLNDGEEMTDEDIRVRQCELMKICESQFESVPKAPPDTGAKYKEFKADRKKVERQEIIERSSDADNMMKLATRLFNGKKKDFIAWLEANDLPTNINELPKVDVENIFKLLIEREQEGK